LGARTGEATVLNPFGGNSQLEIALDTELKNRWN
jgi:hypothetical protein